jgi:hypothetical protein
MRFPRPLALLALSLAAPAFASGVDIAWDNCLGESGAVSLKQFACGSNTGQDALWVSFESAVPASNIGRIEVALDFLTRTGNPLPVWWDFEDFASCRRGALFIDVDPPHETPICARMYTSTNPPTFVVDRIDYQLPTPDAGRMVVAANVTGPLLANQRYLACRFLLSHVKTSACAGCSEPVSITVTAVRVATIVLSNPITNNVALWQQNLPTATRASTWSALKRLYH